jgi:hypothetical protein
VGTNFFSYILNIKIKLLNSSGDLEKLWGMTSYMYTWSIVGGQWSASFSGHFTQGTHWIGGWVDPRAGLDSMEK